MKLKWTLFVALLLGISGISLVAQDGQPPEGPPPGEPPRRGGHGPMAINIETLKTELKLTEEQCKQLKPVLEKIKAVFEAGRPKGKPGEKPESEENQGNTGKRENMKKKMQEMQKKIQAALEPAKKFLSDEQYKALKKKFEPPQNRKGKRPPKKDDSESGSDKTETTESA